MADRIEAKMTELGLTLPEAPAPAANYVPFVVTGGTVYISGQLPMGPDGLVKGTLGASMQTSDGTATAKLCALSLLAQLKKAAGGDLDRVRRVVKLTGFVNSSPDFTDHPAVINGASDLMVSVFGDAGRHSRSAVGVAALPFGAAVEVEGIFEIE